MKKIFLAIAVMTLSACSTSQVSSQEAKQVPKDRVFYNETGTSKITITRDSGWMAGGGCYVMTIIDGKDIARMDTSETITIQVPEGRHILGFKGDKYGNGLCSVGSDKPFKESSIEIKDGETQYFRITGNTNTGLDIRPTSSI
ncbi:hypothetical protein [Candidatus Pantoea bituminis]|uniref:hypothetical protein n=1 Tax=Candidatus Pantoea bituminis TaxID=2831036 RepID=UPI001C05EFBB|nr:hypothetical protein [Pantoea bituminis]